jgi:PAS domain S-box-containing protein
LQDATGRVTGLLVMALDITARREAEEARRRSQDDLKRAQALAKVGCWRLDLCDHRLTWSAETYRLFGIAPETVLTYESFLAAVHPADRELVDQRWRAALEGAPYDIEHRVLVDGQVKWVHEQVAWEFNDQGVRLAGLGTVQDISAHKALEAALREADRRKDAFLATLGHELRNPLAPLRNAAAILKLTGSLDPTVQTVRELIDRQVNHLARLIDDLLDVSRITRGTLTLCPEPVDLAMILERALETVRPVLERAGHTLVVALPPQPLHLEADPVRLTQVFTNLLHNAGKYTPSGGCIGLNVAHAGAELVITVADSGIGIAPEHLPQVFEMFHQVPTAADHVQAGLGIGLALVRGLVQRHGGRVAAASDGLGKGSTFSVWLPAAPVRPVPPARHAAAQRPPVTGRLLVVDDQADVAESLAQVLRLYGNEVRIARDGHEAVVQAERFRPDLVLLDLGMPNLDGYGACRRLREQPWGQALTIIALTGWGQESDRQKSKEAGFDGHWVKPVAPSAILERLAHVLADGGDQSSHPPA